MSNYMDELEWRVDHEHRIARGLEYDVEQLKLQLAEANEKARLQRAIDRIEAAEKVVNIYTHSKAIEVWTPENLHQRRIILNANLQEAAEQAAQWAESQKGIVE